MPEIEFLLEELLKSWLKQSLLVGMTVMFISIHISNFALKLIVVRCLLHSSINTKGLEELTLSCEQYPASRGCVFTV